MILDTTQAHHFLYEFATLHQHLVPQRNSALSPSLYLSHLTSLYLVKNYLVTTGYLVYFIVFTSFLNTYCIKVTSSSILESQRNLSSLEFAVTTHFSLGAQDGSKRRPERLWEYFCKLSFLVDTRSAHHIRRRWHTASMLPIPPTTEATHAIWHQRLGTRYRSYGAAVEIAGDARSADTRTRARYRSW